MKEFVKVLYDIVLFISGCFVLIALYLVFFLQRLFVSKIWGGIFSNSCGIFSFIIGMFTAVGKTFKSDSRANKPLFFSSQQSYKNCF